jgi:hypothetical protein
MDTTLTFQPRKRFRRRDRADATPPAPPAPPAAAPVLVAAAYDAGSSVTLTFDRPVDVAGMDVLVVVVDDGATMSFRYRGFGTPESLGPATVGVALSGFEDYAGPGVTLSVAAGNGIVAADGGLAWPGVTDLPLPFG